MGEKASEWAKKNCRFAQGQPGQPVPGQPPAPPEAPGQLGINFEDPQNPLPPDFKKKVAESLDSIINETNHEVDIDDYSIDPGERQSWESPGYGAYVEDLDATISLKGDNVINMGEEAQAMGFPDAATAHRAFQQAMPINITAKAYSGVSREDRRGEDIGFDLAISGEMTVTGLGPLRPDGTCEFLYFPEPIPVTDWKEQ
jgi:hypothetical protein